MTHKFKINYESNLFAGGNQLTTTPTPTPTSKHIFNFYDQEDYPNKISSDSVSDNKIITSLDVQTRTYILENFLVFQNYENRTEDKRIITLFGDLNLFGVTIYDTYDWFGFHQAILNASGEEQLTHSIILKYLQDINLDLTNFEKYLPPQDSILYSLDEYFLETFVFKTQFNINWGLPAFDDNLSIFKSGSELIYFGEHYEDDKFISKVWLCIDGFFKNEYGRSLDIVRWDDERKIFIFKNRLHQFINYQTGGEYEIKKYTIKATISLDSIQSYEIKKFVRSYLIQPYNFFNNSESFNNLKKNNCFLSNPLPIIDEYRDKITDVEDEEKKTFLALINILKEKVNKNNILPKKKSNLILEDTHYLEFLREIFINIGLGISWSGFIDILAKLFFGTAIFGIPTLIYFGITLGAVTTGTYLSLRPLRAYIDAKYVVYAGKYINKDKKSENVWLCLRYGYFRKSDGNTLDIDGWDDENQCFTFKDREYQKIIKAIN